MPFPCSIPWHNPYRICYEIMSSGLIIRTAVTAKVGDSSQPSKASHSASPVFMGISDHSSLGVCRSPQSTNKPDCCSQHRFISPNVIIPAFSLCSCLFYSLLTLSLSFPLLSASSLTHLFAFFSYPDLSKFPSMLAWCHFAKGIWRDDQVKMMCFPFFPLSLPAVAA